MQRRLDRIRRSYLPILGISKSTIAIIVLIFSFFILAGGVYSVTQQPPPFLYYSTPYGVFMESFWPGLNEQTFGETIFIGFSYAIGAMGLIITVRSAKSAHRPREATTLLLVGVSMLLISFALFQIALLGKGL